MEIKIKCRRGGSKAIKFWAEDAGGYIFADINGQPGDLGWNICRDGKLIGGMLKCDSDNFEDVCKTWAKQYSRNI